MVRNYRKFILSIMLCVGVQLGCGSSTSPNNPEESQKTQSAEPKKDRPIEKAQEPEKKDEVAKIRPAEVLGLRVLPGTSDGTNLPDPQVDLSQRSSLDESTVEESEIHLHH